MRVTAQTLETLEFPFVRELLAGRTVTPMGRPLALALSPLATGEEIVRALDETDEAQRLAEAEGGLPLRGIGALDEIFPIIAREGSILTGREVLVAARFCEVVEGARVFGRRVRGAFPGLGGRAAALPSVQSIASAILGKVSSAGELEDSASPALARIRARIHSTTSALHEKLESILARQDASTFLRDAFVTQRGGRFVVPVRSDSPAPLRGIVHGGSSSGATVFVEPFATVEINNELVRMRDEESAEIERILRVWTEALRERLPELRSAAHEIAALDLAQAKGLLARELASVRPTVAEGTVLFLAEARHPLLEKTLAASGGRIVPIDVSVPAGTSTLIVSGPNAGGKTIVLKTAGLLALMAHAGLFVPAREAAMPLLRQVLVDIGDRQSIEGSLSTFSAHIRNIAEMTRTLELPCLVLIDEIGTGTDPAEGGPLAISLLEWLRTHGASTVATTHHGPVKIYGIETEGVASAAVEFDQATLAPTYRLLAGIAGASSGLDIAERLGLDPAIVASAKTRMSPGEREAEQYLLQLRGLVSSLEEDRRELERLRARLLDEARRARDEAIRSDNERAEKFRGELARELEEFRVKARRSLEGLDERRASIRADRERVRQEAEMRREYERISRAAGPARSGSPEGSSGPFGKSASGPGGNRSSPAADTRGGGPGAEDGGASPAFVLAPGARVLVGPFGREGTIELVEADVVTVLVGAAHFRVRREDCTPAGPAQAPPRWKTLGEAAVRDGPDKGLAAREINLIGLTVEEGLERLDKFLDDALLAGHGEVRVIHGHGTGRLMRAVRQALSRSTQVASHRAGGPSEGGDGATVATLKD